MRRLINAGIVVLVLGIAGILATCAIIRVRYSAARAQCKYNLKEIGLAIRKSYDTFGTFPSATISNKMLPTEKRLSWLVGIAAFMEQQGMYYGLDNTKAWDDERNRMGEYPCRGRFCCPSNGIDTTLITVCPTSYIGISGVGPKAAELSLDSSRVGFFGCQRQIKPEDIKDGMANTIAVMETNWNIGPWTAGGFATVRPFDPAKTPYLGVGRPFGSDHRGVTSACFADGSVHSFTKAIQPEVLEALATIAGGEKIEPLGD